jgi:hypothetical protein
MNRPAPDLSDLPGSSLDVPSTFWEDLISLPTEHLATHALAGIDPEGKIVVGFLDTELRVCLKSRRVLRRRGAEWREVRHPIFRLITVLYLLQASDRPLANEWIGVPELADAHFFQGPHELNTPPILKRFGNDPVGFAGVCRSLGGTEVSMADIAFRLKPFPRIPLCYLLWAGDEEFPPALTLLFDRSIESHLAADGIWALVNLMTEILVKQPPEKYPPD